MSNIPQHVFVEAFTFLPHDSLLRVSHVSSGCRALYQNEMRSTNRRQRYLSSMESLGWASVLEDLKLGAGSLTQCLTYSCLRNLLFHHIDLTANAVNRSGASAMVLPGMPAVDPLSDIDIYWGNHFPSHDGEFEWVHRTESPMYSSSGTHGKVVLGLAVEKSNRRSHVVSCGLLLFSSRGCSFSLTVSILITDNHVDDLYWHYDSGPDRITLLRRSQTPSGDTSAGGRGMSVGQEALISSHPMLFGQLFTFAGDITQKEEKVRVTDVKPFCLTDGCVHGSAHSANVSHMLSLTMLSDTSLKDEEFFRIVEVQHFNEIAKSVEKYQEKVFTIREEVDTMTTPKGVWTYPTGLCFRVDVDVSKTWKQRQDRLQATLRRSLARGARDMFVNAWVPIGAVEQLIP